MAHTEPLSNAPVGRFPRGANRSRRAAGTGANPDAYGFFATTVIFAFCMLGCAMEPATPSVARAFDVVYAVELGDPADQDVTGDS